jgi:hypothetical protein
MRRSEEERGEELGGALNVDLRVGLALSLLEGVPQSVVIVVQVDNLDAKDFAGLIVLGVFGQDRVDVLDDPVWLFVLINILSVFLELSEKALGFAFVKRLFEESIFSQNIKRSSGVAVNLSHNVRKNDSILLLGLVNQLVKDAILVDLQSASFNLAVLLGIGVSADIGNLTTFLGLSSKLLLLG